MGRRLAWSVSAISIVDPVDREEIDRESEERTSRTDGLATGLQPLLTEAGHDPFRMRTQRATMREQVLVVTRRLDDWRRVVELIGSLFRPPLTPSVVALLLRFLSYRVWPLVFLPLSQATVLPSFLSLPLCFRSFRILRFGHCSSTVGALFPLIGSYAFISSLPFLSSHFFIPLSDRGNACFSSQMTGSSTRWEEMSAFLY